MKRLMSLFLSCIFIFGVCFSTPVVASATDGEGVTSSNTIESADCVYTITKDAEESIPGECELTEYKGAASSIDIISSVEDTQTNTEYTVTSIGAEAFKDNVSIVQIIIPETVVTIDEGTLTDCENLKYVVFKTSLKSDVPALVLNEIPQGVSVHDRDCLVREENAYIAKDAVITEYCSCGTEENPVPRGTVTIVCPDVLYGQEYSAKVVLEGTFDESLIDEDSIEYYSGEDKLTSKPMSVNENDEKYTVKLSLSESEFITATADYAIRYLDATDTYEVEKTPVDVESFATKVTINAKEGYQVSVSENEIYGASVDFSENPISFYVKRVGDNATSDVVTIDDVTFDLTVPTVEFKIGDTKLENDVYCEDSATVEVVVTDNENGSGVNEIKYYIGNEETVKDELTDDDWQALEDDMVSITEPGEYVIYIKATDNVGNKAIVGSDAVIIYDEAVITFEEIELIYDGTEKKPDVTVKLDEKELEKADFDVTYQEDSISAGVKTVTVNGKGNYDFSATATYTVNPKAISISKIAVESREYNGTKKVEIVSTESELSGVVDADKSSVELNLDDVTAIVSDANAGENKRVIFEGIPKLKGEKAENYIVAEQPYPEATVTITPKSLVNEAVILDSVEITGLEESYIFEGEEIKPEITIKDGEVTLFENTDYTLTYNNYDKSGTAIITIAFTGNYTGTYALNYEIVEKSIPTADCFMFTAPLLEELVYDGSGKEVTINVVDSISGMGAIENVTYYKDDVAIDGVPVEAGTYTVKIDVAESDKYTKATGLTSANWSFTITQRELSDENITLDKNEFVYNLSVQKPTIAITVDDKTLNEGDYELSYLASDGTEHNCADVGVVTIIVTGKGNYKGEARATYEIIKAPSSLQAPEAAVLEYNGTEQELLKTCAQLVGGLGTIYYSLTGEDGDWATDAPKAKVVGKYKVWYKLVGIDGNYKDVEKSFVEAEITQREIAIENISVVERDYNGSTEVVLGNGGATLSNIIAGENVSVDLNGITASVKDASAGSDKKVIFTGTPVLKGADAGNYKFIENPLPVNVTVKINRKTITVTIEDATAEQYGEMSEFKYVVDEAGLVTGDKMDVKLTSSAKDTKTAGEYIISVDSFTVKNGEKDVTANYQINDAKAKLTIAEHTKHIWENGVCKTCKKACEHSGGSATCLELAVCEICNIAYGTKAEHNWGLAEPVKDATCTEKGLMKLTCIVAGCGEEKEIEVKINENNHDWSTEWKVTTNQTCATVGEEVQVCGYGCGKTQKREIPADGKSHKLGEAVVTKATCAEEGKSVSACEIEGCDYEKVETLPVDKDAHKLQEDWEVTKEPNCVEAGEKTKKCLNTGCTHIVKEEVPADGKSHSLGDGVVTVEPGCTVKGELTQFCQNGDCDYKVSVSIKPDGKTHKFAEEFTVIDPTCIATGVKYKACVNPDCTAKSEETTIAINPVAHKNVVTVNEKTPTCTEKGYTGDKYCYDCKKIFDPGIDIDAKGHTESDWIIDKEATFEETGSKHKECTVCKAQLVTEAIAKITLSTPKVKISNSSSGIKVSWNKVDHALSYNVYRSEQKSDGSYTKWKKISTVDASKTSVTDKKAKEGTRYKYTVKAYNGSYKSGIKGSNKVIYLKAIKPTVEIAKTGIYVKWSANAIADKYIVYRSQLINGSWSDWTKVTTTTGSDVSATDTGVLSGETYKYSVRVAKESDYSYRKASSSLIFLGQPELKTSNIEVGIKGTWSLVDGATGYAIYREEYNPSTKKYVNKLHLGTTGATTKSFTDKSAKPGVKYSYTIVAINGSASSVASSASKLWRLTQPEVTISVTSTGIKGSWTQSAGAKKYTIYRSELVGGKWTKWKSLGNAKATAKTFTDTTVKSGVKYRYTVKAKSTNSSSTVGASNEKLFLAAPVTTSVARVGAVDLNWEKVDGATKYVIYRSEKGSDGKWTSYKKQASLKDKNILSWTDSKVEANKRYKYKVKAYNGSEKSSSKATKSVTVPAG